MDPPGVREQPPTPRHRLHRPLSDPPAGPAHRHRRNSRCADGSRSPGQGPLPRFLDVSGVRERRGAMGRGAARSRKVRLRAASVLDARPRRRSRSAESAGMTLIHMAIAFALRHPAVTSAIIGSRTAEHLASQLGAADIELSDEVLDKIDAIVPSGTNFSWADAGYTPRRALPTPVDVDAHPPPPDEGCRSCDRRNAIE